MPRHRRPTDWSPSDAMAMRIGAALVGMFAGAALGLLLGLFVLFGLEINTSLSLWVFGAAGLGATVGYVASEAGFTLAEGVVHFFVGLVGGQALAIIHPSHDAPTWLKRCLWFGFSVGVVVLLWLAFL